MDLNNLVDHLRAAFSAHERPAYARRRPVQHILWITIPTGLVFSALNFLGGNYPMALVELLVMIFLLLPVVWLVKSDNRIGISETIIMVAAVIVFSTLLVTGGKSGAGSNWVFVYPFVAFYINEQQRAWQWIGLFFLIMVGLAAVSGLGVMQTYYPAAELRVFPVTFLFYVLLAYNFNRIRNQYEERLEARVMRRTEELRYSLEKLKHRALHDDLTGLPNRYLFEDRLAQAIKECERRGYCQLSVAVINLDRFQEINNVLGHNGGDEVLVQMSGRISRTLRASDTVARVGGDSFALILPEADTEATQIVAQKIFRAMDEPFMVHGTAIEMAVSIGAALAPVHGTKPDILLQRADLAMRQAKATQMGVAVVYNEQQDPYSLRKLVLFGKLRKAITNNQLSLVYQPKIDLKSMRIESVEALIRWYDEEEGQVPLGDFIPMAEQTGMINPMSEWVLNEAARQAAEWKSAGLNIPIAVNLSPRNLLNPTLVAEIQSRLTGHGLTGDEIMVEVTENALITHPETALSILTAISEMGIRISIDDFGTGYSSFAYLKNLPVDELKIDQCFVSGMLTNDADRMIVKSTMELAHGLGLSVVAEGVEDREVLLTLKEMGVDKAQGFYMSRPQAPADLKQWLVESQWGLPKPQAKAAC